jgi:hypothetical protein
VTRPVQPKYDGEAPSFIVVHEGPPTLYRMNGDVHTGPRDGQPMMVAYPEGWIVNVRRPPQAPKDKDAPE